MIANTELSSAEGVRPRDAWRRDVIAALRRRLAPRILTSRDIAVLVERARGSANRFAVLRTAAALCADGHLKRVWKGLYVNTLAVPPVNSEEVAEHLKSGAVVSLQSVLGDRVANNPSTVVTAVVPLGKRAEFPSVGEIKTGIGVFRFHGIAKEIFCAGAEEDRLDQTRARYPRATAERAFCDYLYLSQTRRRALPPPPLDLDLSELRLPVVRRLTKAMGIETTLNSWLERKRSHDRSETVADQSNRALGL